MIIFKGLHSKKNTTESKLTRFVNVSFYCGVIA